MEITEVTKAAEKKIREGEEGKNGGEWKQKCPRGRGKKMEEEEEEEEEEEWFPPSCLLPSLLPCSFIIQE